MAALQSIRNRGVLLVSIIALALFLFVIGDAIRGGEVFFNQSKQEIGEVNKNTVSIQEFQKMIEELTNYYEIAQQKSGFSEEENNRIKDEAWQQYVQYQLIKKEADKIGLAVSNDEISEVVKSGYSQYLQLPVFMNQQTGRYDYATVTAFLTQYQQAKESGQQLNETFEKVYRAYIFAQKSIRNQLLVQKYQALLSQAFVANKVEAKMSFDGRATEADILIASVPAITVADKDVEVTDADIKAKYNEDKEKYLQTVETRDIKIIDVQVTPSNADKKATEARFDEYYKNLSAAASNEAAGNVVRQSSSLLSYTDILKTKDAYPALISLFLDSVEVNVTTKPEYSVPSNAYSTFRVLQKQMQADSVLFRQIGVSGKDAADTKKKSDSIYNAIVAGADFKAIAKKYNQTGDSSWIASQQFQTAQLDADNIKFIKTVYSTGAGQTAQLSLENGVNIIIQVLETRNPVMKYNVAAVVQELKFSDETYNQAYNKFSSFVAENKTIESIEANAVKAGYTVLPLNDVVSSSHNIANLRNTRDAMKWLFDDANVGDVSTIYECGTNDHILLVSLAGINKKGYRSVEKVSDVIKAELMLEKKVEKIASGIKATSFAEASKVSGAVCDTLKHVSFASPCFVAATNASEPLVSAAAAKTAKGQFEGPVKGNNGVYMLQVLNQTKTSEKFDEKAEIQSLAGNYFRYAANSIMNVLYLNGNVTDNRYKFF